MCEWAESLGITACWLNTVSPHGRCNLRMFSRFCRIESIAWGKDCVDRRGADNQNAVNWKPWPCLRFQRSRPTRKFRVLSGHVACSSRYLESFLDEDIDKADTHKWIDFDVSHAGRRGDVRNDKVFSIKDGEDFLW